MRGAVTLPTTPTCESPVAERDRRPDGRPEQTRPRDRTGRPLPYGTTGVPLTEEHEPDTVEEALRLGVELWAQQRLFEAHECLEFVWHAAPEADRDLWQGVIQVAVAGVHLQRDNPDGAAATFRKAARRLRPYPDVHRGVRVDVLRDVCAAGAAALDAGDVAAVGLPQLATVPDGAWFTADPAALEVPTGPTPIDRTPAWQQRPRRRTTSDHPDEPGATP